MKTGINQWVFPAEMPVAHALAMAKEIGFDAFEVCVGDKGPVSLDISEKEVTAIRVHAEKLGIAVTSVASGMGWQYPLSAPDPKVRERGKDAVRQSLRIARWLGADAVLVVPGVVTPDTPYDLALENALASLQDLVPDAEQLQIAIAIENVWRCAIS